MRVLAAPAFSNQQVNPYNALLYREVNKLTSVVEEYSHREALLTRYDILHFHWPDGYINEPNLLKALQRISVMVLIVISAKLKRAKIVWTVHNIVPHDSYRPTLSRQFMRWFVNVCDGFIFMSAQGKSDFNAHYAAAEYKATAIIPHGHYRYSYPAVLTNVGDAAGYAAVKQNARQQLDVPMDKTVLLCFGMIKAYKNVGQLLEVFINAKLNNCLLIVAGNAESSELMQQLKSIGGRHPDIMLSLQFIPDDQVSLYHHAADIAILPYKQILNSGALLLALSFNKPVIAPHIGAFATLQQELGSKWIHTYNGELTCENLTAAVQAVSQGQRPPICPLESFNWDYLAQLTLNFYQDLQ
jgi:beta-1,4-mannosyltransferase